MIDGADLGRRRGWFIPVDDAQAYAANGWSIADDLAGLSGGTIEIDGNAIAVVLMVPPPEPDEGRAA